MIYILIRPTSDEMQIDCKPSSGSGRSLGCWSHLDSAAVRLKGSGQTGQISLKDVVYQDAGTYKCVGQSSGSNRKRLDQPQTPVLPEAKGKPRWEWSPGSMSGQLVFNCVRSGKKGKQKRAVSIDFPLSQFFQYTFPCRIPVRAETAEDDDQKRFLPGFFTIPCKSIGNVASISYCKTDRYGAPIPVRNTTPRLAAS
ncbi:AGAP011094-PA-like protein [Anopheles sinensis]|uniref:AGAP011094-PA-like protein n=1 Tax=Anopheles sinensis TaxID=74873 RepID=A0A084W8E6_ANOSI|nr:AGAP011094-PA-like protein [Anopheles sinensis]